MPFKSTRQIQTCFGKQLTAMKNGQKWTWDCEENLKKTPDTNCLPTLVTSTKKLPKCRKLSPKQKVVSPVYEGARGGLYFYAGDVKVYVPKGTENIAINKYGFEGTENVKSPKKSTRRSPRRGRSGSGI